VNALGVVVVTDCRLWAKLRYVGNQTSACLPPAGPESLADASAGAPSGGVIASASLPPELEPLELPLEELPVAPLLDPLDPLLEPELDPPPEEEPPSTGGVPCVPVPQPAASANANATSTDERIAPLLMATARRPAT
jgi:hypothetical protein